MQKIDKETKNILIGTAIGGILGVCTASIFLASRNQAKERAPSMDTLSKIITHFGEVLSDQDIKKTSIVKGIEKKINKHENTIDDVLNIISSGLHLWNRIKKG